jgi:hypothetical protein
VEEEFLQGGLRECRAAPDAGAAGAAVLDIGGGERAAGGEFREDVFREFLLVLGQTAGPCAVVLRAAVHGGDEVRPCIERECGQDGRIRQMVLEAGALVRREDGAVAMEMLHQAANLIVLDAVAQDQVMHAAADIDGIDLDVAVMRERCAGVRERGVQTGGAAGEEPGGPAADRQRGHSVRLMTAVPSFTVSGG